MILVIVMSKLILTVLAMLGLAGAAQACPNWNLNPSYGSFNLSAGQMRSPQTLSLLAGGDNYIWNCRNVNPQTDVGAGYSPRSFNIVAGGDNYLPDCGFGSNNVGYFPTTPDFSFDLSNMNGYRLEISVLSNCDAALLVNTADTQWFYDDDSNGQADPRINLSDRQVGNGVLDVWIGTYDGDYCDATLTLETF